MKLVANLALALALAFAPCEAARSDDSANPGFSDYEAADATAPPVTEENVFASERFWPYRVALTESFQSETGRTLRKGLIGVLIRMEAGGSARIDFGRHGLIEVPIALTDLVDRANQVRTGTLPKSGPNFVWAVGNRMLEANGGEPEPAPVDAMLSKRAFLAVFADPRAESFPTLAAALLPLRHREGLETFLFPQGGGRPDVQVGERLKELGWTVPFARDHLSEPYTETLLDEATKPPAVLLQTPEGRILFASAWVPSTADRLTKAIDRELGAGAVKAPIGP